MQFQIVYAMLYYRCSISSTYAHAPSQCKILVDPISLNTIKLESTSTQTRRNIIYTSSPSALLCPHPYLHYLSLVKEIMRNPVFSPIHSINRDTLNKIIFVAKIMDYNSRVGDHELDFWEIRWENEIY